MTGPRIGSLCSGYGGLESGLMQVVGGSVAWHCENDPHATRVLEAHWPGVPNYGDITTLDWAAVEPVEWFTAGYPCQPESLAGKGLSTDDERWIWPDIARAIGVLRPRHVLLENVAGHVGRGLRTVLGSLASLRYDMRWTVVRASDAGAPHERARVFIVATDTDSLGHERPRGTRGRRRGPADLSQLVANANLCGRRPDDSGVHERQPDIAGRAPADAASDGWREGWAESAGIVGRPDAAERRLSPAPDANGAEQPRQRLRHPRAASPRHCEALCAVDRDWRGEDGRDYGPAVRRWHDLTRCVPPPTIPDGRNGAHRLNPRFTEWMMGLPAGWVTDVLPRNPALKCLGNGVVPQQCALAVRLLLDTETAAA
jgi:DNA (cytosine-5)-methyltransferase 1